MLKIKSEFIQLSKLKGCVSMRVLLQSVFQFQQGAIQRKKPVARTGL